MKTIVTSYFGSKLYGTNTPQSDTDYYRIIVPSAQEIIFGDDSIQTSSTNLGKNTSADEDLTIMSVKKYIEQCMVGELNAISLLYAPQSSLLNDSPEWSYLQAHRYRFITTRMKMFGFIYGNIKQLNKKEDFKLASNVLRVIEQAKQLFTDGFITYPINNAETIISIKSKELEYSKVLKLIETSLQGLERVKTDNKQKWPEEISEYNKQFFNSFIYDVYKESLYRTL